jgi:hypothetical protein
VLDAKDARRERAGVVARKHRHRAIAR